MEQRLNGFTAGLSKGKTLGNAADLVIRNLLALCYISHIICGREHPPNFIAMRLIEWETLPAPAWGECQGAQAALASGGTAAPLSSTKTLFPHGQGRIRREGASEAAPEAVRQAVGGGR